MRDLQNFPFTKRSIRRIVIACHRHADIDAYCSAYGLLNLFKLLFPRIKVDVACPDGLSIPTRTLAVKFHVRILHEIPSSIAYDLLIAVDTGNIQLLKDWLPIFQKTKGFKILIDHHPLTRESRRFFNYRLVDERSSSTSEIVARLWVARELRPPRRVANALLAGILADSRHLSGVGCETISIVSKLCDYGANIRFVKDLLTMPREPSEAMARLKAAQRMVLKKIEGWNLATSVVGAYQASAAKALVDLGADVAAVLGESEGITKGSIRCTETFYRGTRLHLGKDVVPRFLEMVGQGTGGGHPTAASFNIHSSPEVLQKLLISLFQQLLRAK